MIRFESSQKFKTATSPTPSLKARLASLGDSMALLMT